MLTHRLQHLLSLALRLIVHRKSAQVLSLCISSIGIDEEHFIVLTARATFLGHLLLAHLVDHLELLSIA